jgi:hypothetical protein
MRSVEMISFEWPAGSYHRLVIWPEADCIEGPATLTAATSAGPIRASRGVRGLKFPAVIRRLVQLADLWPAKTEPGLLPRLP